MRKILLTLLFVLPVQALWGVEPPERQHQVRLGWGDMIFETVAFPAAASEQGGRGFTGHFFAGYQYSVNPVVSLGGQLDFEGIFMADMNNYNLTLMPTVRFTYLRSEAWELHSGVGLGALFAFDNKGGAQLAPAIDLNFFGFQAGKGPLKVGVDLGMLNALTGGKKIYMLGSRLLSVSLNYSF